MSERTSAADCTDDELRSAVANERSWRGVLRSLGYKPHSASITRTFKRRAALLDLDTSHFTGQRRWSDPKLAAAVAQAGSWSDVLTELGLDDNVDARIRAKGHARRLQLDVSHLERPKVQLVQQDDCLTKEPRLAALRNVAPSIVAAWFMVRGLTVAFPVEPQVYDLLVSMPDGIQRVQVKSTTYRAPNGRWQVGLRRHKGTSTKSLAKLPYDPDSIDYFAIVTGTGKIYLLPSKVIAGRSGIHLDRYAHYKVGDASSLLATVPAPDDGLEAAG